MGIDFLLWPAGIALLALRALLNQSQLLSRLSKGKFDWLAFIQFVLLLFGVWVLFTAPLPWFPEGWQSIAQIVGSVLLAVGTGVASVFGASAGAAEITFSIAFGILLAAAVIDLLDLNPEKRAKTLVFAAPPLAWASVGWIATMFTGAVQWVALAGPTALINAVT